MSSLSISLADSPDAGFRLGEPSNLGAPWTAADASGNNVAATYRNNAGALYGVTLGAASLLGRDADTAATFDGVNGVFAVTDPAALDYRGEMAIKMSFKLPSVPGNGVAWSLASKGSTGPAGSATGSEGYSLLLIGGSGSQTLQFATYDSPANTTTAASVVVNWSAGEKHHVAGVCDGQYRRLYADGVEVAAVEDPVGAIPSLAPLLVGGQFQNSAIGRVAAITADEVWLYPRGLSAAQIARHYAADTALPAWTTAQADYVSLARGQFIHFSAATFQTDWQYTSLLDPAEFFPAADPAYMIDQWLAAGRLFGSRYAVLTASHGDGFRTYPSAQTDYGITASPWYARHGNFDLCGAFAAACRAKGLKVGYYLSVVDYNYMRNVKPSWTHPELQAWTIAKAVEIARAYTPDVLWIDNLGYGFSEAQVSFAAIKAAVNAVAPGCLVVANNHEGTLAHSDIASWEHSDSVPPGNNTLPGELCLTLLQNPLTGWFDHGVDEPLHKASTIKALFDTNVRRHANVLLNTPPDRTGLVPQKQLRVLREFSTGAGIDPPANRVSAGVGYGPNGDDYTGTAAGNGENMRQDFPSGGATLTAPVAATGEAAATDLLTLTPAAPADWLNATAIAPPDNKTDVLVRLVGYATSQAVPTVIEDRVIRAGEKTTFRQRNLEERHNDTLYAIRAWKLSPTGSASVQLQASCG